MKNIDIEIYRTQIEHGVDFKAMAEEFQLNEDEVREAFIEELLIKAEENIIECGDPTLTEDQFIDCMMAAVTKIHVQHLVDEGLLQGEVDTDSGENVYKLTDKGKTVASKI
jgi:hypothetical protein